MSGKKLFFCPRCGTLLRPVKMGGSSVLWVCSKCGYKCSGDYNGPVYERGNESSYGDIDYVNRMLSLQKILRMEKKRVFREAMENILRCEVIDDYESLVMLQLENEFFSTMLEAGSSIGVVLGDEIRSLGVIIDSFGAELTVLKHSGGRSLYLEPGSIISIVPLEPLVAYDLQITITDYALNNTVSLKEADYNDNSIIIQNPEAINLFMNTGCSCRVNKKAPRVERVFLNYSFELDESQRRVVEASLNLDDNELLLVVGPPGTGKTRVISCIARLLADRGEKVLIASHTNRAVDNAVLLLPIEYTLRVGRPEKLLDEVKPYMLCSYNRKPFGEKLRSIDEELSNLLHMKRMLVKKYCLRSRFKKLLEKDFERVRRSLEDISSRITELLRVRVDLIKTIVQTEVSRARIIGSTLVKSQLPPLSSQELFFDTIIIDEASQASASLALLAMVRGRKWIVVGDHKQLPPIFKCSVKDSVKYSAFTWLMEIYGERVLWLTTHYRSNSEIIGVASKYVYEGRIKPHISCYGKKLVLNKPVRNKVLDPDKPIVFIHVKENPECIIKEGRSVGNKCEAEVAMEIVESLVNHGVNPEDIGVITPYRLQALIISEKLRNRGLYNVEVSTVDSFQGREKDVVIISLSSTSPSRITFVSEPHRLNVALTRAIKKLIIIGDAKNITNNPSSKKLLLSKILNYCITKDRVYDWANDTWVGASNCLIN